MTFHETDISGLTVIDPEMHSDERGFFSRTVCKREFEYHGLESGFVQQNLSFSKAKYTWRGLHRQKDPHAEIKLVRCIQGALFDVAVDLRPNSSTYCKWYCVELTEDNHRALYIPRGFLHGFLTLEENTKALYDVSAFYNASFEEGFRYDDAAFQIKLPTDPVVVSAKDLSWLDFSYRS